MGKKSKGPSIGTRMSLGGYDDLLDKYDVQGPSFGRGGNEYRSPEDVERDLLKAAAGHGATINTLQSAALSGKKKAQDLIKNGFQNIGDLTNVENFFEKSAKRHGMGGDFSSPSDYVGLSYSMAQRDRRKLLEDLEPEEVEEEKVKKPVEPIEVNMPYHVAQSAASVDSFHANMGDLFDGRTRGEFAQKLKDDYVGRLTEYSDTHIAGEEPWMKGPSTEEGQDDMQQDTAVMPYAAAGIIGLY